MMYIMQTMNIRAYELHIDEGRCIALMRGRVR